VGRRVEIPQMVRERLEERWNDVMLPRTGLANYESLVTTVQRDERKSDYAKLIHSA
jgi:hypothetical protein